MKGGVYRMLTYEHEADKQTPRKGENKPCHEVKQSHDKRQGEKPPCGGGEEINHRSPKD